jgi:serine/threonine protein kinase/tetratricopeptide (TPR) repeat protein
VSAGPTGHDGTERPREPETGRAGGGSASDADEIVGLCRERLERGERLDVDAICREHPSIGGVLRERLAVLLLIHGAGAPPTPDGAGGTPLVGAAVGSWRLVAELGSGGMGTVFLAESGAERRAVKVLHPHLLARPGSFKRFLREAEIGRKVRHPNVVATLDADATEVGGRTIHYLVMEYVEGRTLRSLLGELGRVPEELCRHIGREAALALAAVHAAGAVHRDVKPENLLITRDQVVKLMDLGVSREAAGEALRVSETGAFVGSVRYAAPEQFRSRTAALDGRADLYALGLTLYELATGAHPFPGDDFHAVLRRQLTETPRPAGEVNQQISPFFEEVLRRLLDKDAEKRVASAAELAAILEAGERSAWWTDRAQAIRDESRRPLRRIRIPRETALYGRGEELTKLRAAFESAKTGEGRVVLLEGEAGIGKSRLADEFVATLRREGEDLDFLFGSYPPGGAATAAGAFTTAYHEHFGDDLAALGAALPEQPLLVPAFAALLRGDAAPTGAEPLTRDSLQTVFVRVTQSLARERPVVVLIDDLHFAPEEGRALFLSLAHAVPGHRILLLGTARPGLPDGFLSSISRLDHCARLPLPRLGPKDLARLLVDAFRSERLAEELAFKIGAKSDGNPWFVFEILRGLREGQFLRRRPDGTWVTTRVIEEVEVPSTVKDLVFGRVGDLATEDRNLLDVAAVAGFEFDAALVGEVLGLGRIPSLQRLAGVEKTHHLVHSAGRKFVFDHHQVAEVLYAALPEPLREEYHAALGDAIERRHGAAAKEPKDVEGAVCVELAEHFLKGGRGDRALRYLDGGLRHLELGYANEPAVRLIDRALGAPDLVEGDERVRLLQRKAQRLSLLGRSADEEQAHREAARLAEALPDPLRRAGALSELGWFLARVSRLDEAQRVLEQSLRAAESIPHRLAVGTAIQNLGLVSLRRGRPAEALAHIERAFALVEPGDEAGVGAQVSGNLATALSRLGRHDEALALYERQLETVRALGNPRAEAGACTNLSCELERLGRYVEARDAGERALTIARRIGDRRVEATAAANLALAHSRLGNADLGITLYEHAARLAHEIGDVAGEANAVSDLGIVLAQRGRFAESLAHREHGAAFYRRIGNRLAEAVATGQVGLCLASLGRWAEARASIEQSLRGTREFGDRSGQAVALVNLGPLLVGLGDSEGGRAMLEESLAVAREIRRPFVEAYALVGLGDAAAQEGAWDDAVRLAAASLDVRGRIRNRQNVAESRLALGRIRLLAGDATGARADLTRALAEGRELDLAGVIVLATSFLALLAGGDAAAVGFAREAFAALRPRLPMVEALEARWVLWRATGDRTHLVEAKRLLDHLVEHAPPECRGPMLANVRLHREVAEAARANDL